MGSTFTLRRTDGGSAIRGVRTFRAPGVVQLLTSTIAGQSTITADMVCKRILGGTIAATSELSGRLFVDWYLQGTITIISVVRGSLTVIRLTPPLADAIARRTHIPMFADAWQQPKEPPDG